MIYTTNIEVLPLMLVAWAIDAYLFITLIRILDRRLSILPSRFSTAVRELGDGIPCIVEGWLDGRRRRTGQVVPSWLAWTISIIAVVLIRHLLVLIVVAVC